MPRGAYRPEFVHALYARCPADLAVVWQQTRAEHGACENHQVVDTHQPDMHGPVKVARGHGFIRAAPEDVLHMLIAIERRPDWDDLCDYGSQVREKQGVRKRVLCNRLSGAALPRACLHM